MKELKTATSYVWLYRDRSAALADVCRVVLALTTAQLPQQ